MKNNFSFLKNDAVFFEDSLKKDYPYIAKKPRNHESLFFVKKGKLLYEKDDLKAVVSEGQVGYITKGSCDVSGAYMCDEVSYIAVNFCFGTEVFPPEGNLPFQTLCSDGHLHYPYKSLFKRGLEESSQKDDGSDYIANGVLMEIIGYLHKDRDLSQMDIKKYKKIERAVEYMKSHCDDEYFRISELSRISQMSEKNFRRIFGALYGQTPYAFLQKLRVEKAEILLLNTNKSVLEIALSCGFSDVYSFSHSFKRHFGLSPQNYRASANNV
ncbi:MAG: helix-turn-helix transcriptional regulator [Clostridia bacterium]|nr:helix-turn-helix transcriptional regulator [Clostridia bacterium]